MKSSLGQHFHRYLLTEALRSIQGDNDKEIERTKLKSYPRFRRIRLFNEALPLGDLTDALSKRISMWKFDKTHPPSLTEIGSILLYGSGENSLRSSEASFRRYVPSGGGRYPLEAYISLAEGSDLPAGLYHYHAPSHSLEVLFEGVSATLAETIEYEFIRSAPCFIIITAEWQRSFSKYGDVGYLLSVLEAGHVSQTMLLVAQSLGIGGRPVLGFDYEKLCNALDIDGIEEAPVQLIAFGKEEKPS